VLERVIDDWLTKTTERAFQAPFCQMLAAQGETIIHSSRHCTMELGKDVISIATDGRVHAYQLKSTTTDRLSFSAWRNGLQKQAFDLVATAVRHPSISSKKHHRSFFVVNGSIEEEVSEDIQRMNEAWASQGFPDYKLETIVLGQLVEMATSLESSLWPDEVRDVNSILQLYLDSGEGQLPKERFAQLLESTARLSETNREKISKAECVRLMASTGVLCALALTRFTEKENRLAEIEGWTIYLAVVFGLAQRHNLPRKLWSPFVDLASMFIQGLLEHLAEDARNITNLIVGDPLSDRFVREIRITHLTALFSLFWNWRRFLQTELSEIDEFLRSFCVNNSPYLLLWGEAAAPQLLAAYWGLQSMAPALHTDKLLLSQIDLISKVNGREGSGLLFSPYYGPEDVFEYLFEISDEDIPESFRRRSHTIECFIALAVRENLRQGMRYRWPGISHLMFAEFQAEKKWHYCRHRNQGEGKLILRDPNDRQSWSELRGLYDGSGESDLPRVLKDYPIQTLLILICYPHRLRSSWVIWLDDRFRKLV